MKDTFHTNTRLTGVIGHPIKHSYSAYIHNISFDLKNLDYIYLPFDVPVSNLRAALKGMVALNIKGFNVTIPHKEKIIDYLNDISEEASILGAVNTIVNDLGKLQGYNTDVYGVLETLKPYKEKLNGKEVTVVGAGGSARAVIYTLIRYFKPAGITIVNRTEQRAEALKKYFSDKTRFDAFRVRELFPPDLVEVFRESALIVNATPVGMYPETDDAITSLGDSFKKGQLVFDLVYNPPVSRLLKLAASRGATIIDGLNMLVHQAAKSFELWTGEQMPIDKIYKSLQLVVYK
ncbi:MAG: shikimate dehydrogenase [Ignavibacteriaceae bacterium]